MAGIARTEQLIETSGFLLRFTVLTGIFLALHTLFMDRECLQDPWIPLHIALLGILGSTVFLKIKIKKGIREFFALLGFSFFLTLLVGSFRLGGVVLGLGWAILATWSAWIAVRGGEK